MINKVILLGNRGKDPDTALFISSGKAVTRFSLATSNTWTDVERRKVVGNRMAYRRCLGKTGRGLWPRLAEKGRQVYVEGALRHRSYDNKEGKEQHVTEIVAQKVRFLGGGSNGKSSEPDISVLPG